MQLRVGFPGMGPVAQPQVPPMGFDPPGPCRNSNSNLEDPRSARCGRAQSRSRYPRTRSPKRSSRSWKRASRSRLSSLRSRQPYNSVLGDFSMGKMLLTERQQEPPRRSVRRRVPPQGLNTRRKRPTAVRRQVLRCRLVTRYLPARQTPPVLHPSRMKTLSSPVRSERFLRGLFFTRQRGCTCD